MKSKPHRSIIIAGSNDRDANGIPYSSGTRKERRKLNKQIGKMAERLRRLKEKVRGTKDGRLSDGPEGSQQATGSPQQGDPTA